MLPRSEKTRKIKRGRKHTISNKINKERNKRVNSYGCC